MTPTSFESQTPTYTLELLEDDKTVERRTFATARLRYSAFVDLLQKTTRIPDGVKRTYIFSTIDDAGFTIEAPTYAGFWTGVAYSESMLELSTKFLH